MLWWDEGGEGRKEKVSEYSKLEGGGGEVEEGRRMRRRGKEGRERRKGRKGGGREDDLPTMATHSKFSGSGTHDRRVHMDTNVKAGTNPSSHLNSALSPSIVWLELKFTSDPFMGGCGSSHESIILYESASVNGDCLSG